VKGEPRKTAWDVVSGAAKWVVMVTMPVSLYLVFIYSPVEKLQGYPQKIFYFHVPSAITAFISIYVVAGAGILYLVKKDRKWDIVALSSAEIGLVFATLVLITGPIWARPIWGTWWTWDAPLTLTLTLWFIFVAYMMLRTYSSSWLQGARYSAVLGIIGALDVPIIRMAIIRLRTLHPKPVIREGGLEHSMALTFAVSLITFIFLYIYLMSMRMSLEKARDDLAAVKSSDGA
jgi:heme exporter protein C